MAAYSIIFRRVPSKLAKNAAPAGTPGFVLTAPALVVVVVAVVWSWHYGGFPDTYWYPGAVVVLLVLAAVAMGLRPSLRGLPRDVLIAVGALALYTAWSFASIAWADAQGVAWDGANRTLLYLVMFTIPVLSPLDGPRALLVIGGWTAGIVALGVCVLLALPGAVGPGPATLGPGLAAPTGYTNAQACLWLMAASSAFFLSTRHAVPPALRGLLAAGAVVLIDLALLCGSRGAELAAAITLAVALALLPGRVRTLLGLVPIAIGMGLSAPRVLDVADALRLGSSADLGSVAAPVLLSAALTGVIAAAAARAEHKRPLPAHVALRLRRAVAATAIGAAIVGAGGLLAAAGDPVERVQQGWHSFKDGAGAGAGSGPGFGDARYDYYRVALNLVIDDPLQGVGADNFAHDYAARGRTSEFPAYVHSLVLRALVHTGIVGGLLLALALGAALWAGLRAARTGAGETLAAAAAGAATIVAVHWIVQGSADWFWEFPALGGPAFALLGVACALAPRGAPTPRRRTARASVGRAPRGVRLGGAVVGAVLVMAATVSLVAPWTAALAVQRATDVWPKDPAAAFRQLDLAADLNPLSPRPALIEGTIALRLGRLDRARAAFERAVKRDARDPYAPLALGAIASRQGQRARAIALLRRAGKLNPQDGPTQAALQRVVAGERIDIPALLRQLGQVARDAGS